MDLENNSIFEYFKDLISDISALDAQTILYAMLVVCAIVVLSKIGSAVSAQQKEIGLDQPTPAVNLDGSEILPSKEYVSKKLGLSGKPDALVIENGFKIPIERKPLARKIRDRHVAQLLVYMRLVEEFEGQRPPYGYLILGEQCRKIKIENSVERQLWLQQILDQMQTVLYGGKVAATPHVIKCGKCTVGHKCEFKVG